MIFTRKNVMPRYFTLYEILIKNYCKNHHLKYLTGVGSDNDISIEEYEKYYGNILMVQKENF